MRIVQSLILSVMVLVGSVSAYSASGEKAWPGCSQNMGVLACSAGSYANGDIYCELTCGGLSNAYGNAPGTLGHDVVQYGPTVGGIQYATTYKLFATSGYWKITIIANGSPYSQLISSIAYLGSTDSDGDGIGNNGDNCAMISNADQNNTDGDSQGDVCDADDDNDGVPDINDTFPLNPTEWLDTDSDTIGNNADWDDDGDGVPDTVDAAPLDNADTTEVVLPLDGIYKGMTFKQDNTAQ